MKHILPLLLFMPLLVTAQGSKEAKSQIVGTLLVLAIIFTGFGVGFMIAKRHKQRQDEYDGFKSDVDEIEHTLSRYQALVTIGRYYKMSEAQILQSKIDSFVNPHFTNRNQYEPYIKAFKREDWSCVDKIRSVSEIVGSAKSILKSYPTNLELRSIWEDHKNKLNSLLFDTNSYTFDLEKCFDKIREYSLVYTFLANKVNSPSFSSVEQFTKNLESVHSDIQSMFGEFTKIYSDDQLKKFQAKNASKILASKISHKRGFCLAAGVDNVTGQLDSDRLDDIGIQLVKFSGDPKHDYHLYTHLEDQLDKITKSEEQYNTYRNKVDKTII